MSREEELMAQARELQTNARYSIFRHRGYGERELVECGLRLAEARTKAEQLGEAYRKANPGKTSWGSDLYILELEGGDEINRLFAEARVERSAEYARRTKVTQ